MPAHPVIVDRQKCPAPLAHLLEKHGNKYAPVAELFGVTTGNLGKWVRGLQPIPTQHLKRLVELLHTNGEDVEQVVPEEHRGRWNRNVDTSNWPPLLAELVAKHKGNISAAARALGHRTPHAINQVVQGKRAFTDAFKQKVRDAIAGKIEPAEAYVYKGKKPAVNEELDQGELGLAIVIASSDKITGLYDAAEILGGKNVFRKKMGDHWLFISRFDEDKQMMAYKTIARLVAECITP